MERLQIEKLDAEKQRQADEQALKAREKAMFLELEKRMSTYESHKLIKPPKLIHSEHTNTQEKKMS